VRAVTSLSSPLDIFILYFSKEVLLLSIATISLRSVVYRCLFWFTVIAVLLPYQAHAQRVAPSEDGRVIRP